MKTLFFANYSQRIEKHSSKATYEVLLDTNEMSFMEHHFFGGKCLIPGAIMADIMLTSIANFLQSSDVYPLKLVSMDIRRGIQVDAGDATTIKVLVSKKGSNPKAYKASILSDIKKKGKVIRQDVVVAGCEIDITCKAGGDLCPEDLKDITDKSRRYKLSQEKFYDFFVKTHGDLFQSLTGEISISEDSKRLKCLFNISNKEERYSKKENLCFLLSPLGFDSVLQTAVTSSVVNPCCENSTFYYTKLPVLVENYIMLEPYQANTDYSCLCRVNKLTENDLELSASIHKSSLPVGYIKKIELKKAPFVRFEEGEQTKKLEQFEAK